MQRRRRRRREAAGPPSLVLGQRRRPPKPPRLGSQGSLGDLGFSYDTASGMWRPPLQADDSIEAIAPSAAPRQTPAEPKEVAGGELRPPSVAGGARGSPKHIEQQRVPQRVMLSKVQAKVNTGRAV